jgi:hypothetical protein
MLPAISGGFAGAPFQQELRCRLQDRKSEGREVRKTINQTPGGREVRKNKIKVLLFLLSGVPGFNYWFLINREAYYLSRQHITF